MALSEKYGRTYHYPFSPGTTSDDRINHQFADDLGSITDLIHTEKLDGENNCLSRHGVFARSHAAPTLSPWTSSIRQRWQTIRHDLGNLEIFGENLFAIHSIAYQRLDQHFFVFGVRELGMWLSWEETQLYAQLLDLPTVPVLARSRAPLRADAVEADVLTLVAQPSVFGSVDVYTGQPCTREGVVSRDAGAYSIADFPNRVFKYVRKGHVQTDQHWTRTWRRAPLTGETNSKWIGN
ncbi:RNA ligase family protein [Fibrella forsythiae]|uniref:RNA ligase family protein n=1 Tax=Fibrella forsythiae TaxID=2817061 RepID=A0ABS3JH95_9BACT|nr:RNA ligase family protein [Fibrella forsythiae]MBO0949376.1 RNA ligase family protein [Fibrella forsythiae]